MAEKGELRRMLFNNEAASDNTRVSAKKPLEAPEFNDEQKRALETVVEGKPTGNYKFDTWDARRSAINEINGKGNTMVDVNGEYEMPDGSKRTIKEGEMRGIELVRKSNEKREGKESGIYDDELTKTAKRIELDNDGKTVWQKIEELDPNADIDAMKRDGIDPQEYLDAIEAERNYKETNNRPRISSLLFDEKIRNKRESE